MTTRVVPKAYTIPQAARVSGCSEWAIRGAIARGQLKAWRRGRRVYRVLDEELGRWMREQGGKDEQS